MKKKSKGRPSPSVRKELSFLEAVSRRCPEDVETLKALGELYTKLDLHEDCLQTDLALTRVCREEPLVWYNLACSFAVLQRKDEAFDALSRAIDLGYRDQSWLRRDKDLESIRGDQRFRVLLKRIGA
ncbi:MAG: hypothetical protein ABR497_00890 [Kiritimatiellia bacterium]|nr:hypothetical protein [Lentisphaerota bacterium]